MNSEQNKFFLWVWRINGIAILIVTIFAGIFMFRIFTNIFWERPQDPVITNVAEDPKGEERWVLGRPSQISGSDYIMIPLVSEKDAVDLSAKGVASRVVHSKYVGHPSKNILFINGANNSSRWLFNTNDQLLTGIETSPSSFRYNDDIRETRAIFYQVILRDTNDDKILDDKDDLSLAISRPDGSAYKVVIDNLDRVVSKSLASKNNVLIVYQSKGIGYSLLLDLTQFNISKKAELPKVK